MVFDIDTTQRKLEPYKLVYKINAFLEMIKKKADILAVPFYIGATHINDNCNKLYVSKIGSETVYWCSEKEFRTGYSRTGAKMVSCKDCPFFKHN